ncbi:MAG: helix-turn-helix domain-containing protein [Bacillota bacterium]
MKVLLGTREAATRLGVSPWTLRFWIRSGLLPAFKINNGRWRIDSRDLEEFVHRWRTQKDAPKSPTRRG